LLEISIKDQGNSLGLSGCEECFTTIPLFEHAKDLLTEEEINFAKAQMNKN
jgi:hypothetical protein